MKKLCFFVWIAMAVYAEGFGQSYNTGTGTNALAVITTGDANTATGYDAQHWSNYVYNNSSHGTWTLFVNYGSTNNSAYGGSSMYNNGTGYENSAMGFRSLFSNTAGYRNTAVGTEAMYSTDNTGLSSAFGYYALHANVYGNNSTAVGAYAGVTSEQDNNTFVGAYADASTSSITNSTAIGYGATVTASYNIRFGDNSIGSIGGNSGWWVFSDKRVKTNITANVPGMQFIRLLTPVTYHLSLDAMDAIIKRKNPVPQTEASIAARKAKEKVLYSGFLAQDVEAAAQSIQYDFSGVDAAKNDNDLYGLRYAEFVVPLVKAAQELSATQDSLTTQVDNLTQQVQAALQELTDLKAKQQACAEQVTNSSGLSKSLPSDETNGYLQQNVPNPYESSTTIRYRLPSGATSGQIVITDVNGQALKTYPITRSGQLVITDGQITSGTYVYTLIVNGKRIDSKRMIAIKK